mgnify:CR=1 FL=1
MSEWREIFRIGDYGPKGQYSQADLDAIVQNFNARDQVPIVVGHPETNSPAWGWVKALRRVGGILQAQEGDIHPAFSKAREERLFKNRSVRLAQTKKGPKLLHLGYLGAALPEVEGLSGVVFVGEPEDEVSVDFALVHTQQEETGMDEPKEQEMQEQEKPVFSAEERDKLLARIDELEKALAEEKAKRAEEERQAEEAEFSRFAQKELIDTGRLPAVEKERLVAFMVSLPKEAVADFAAEEGTTRSARAWFMDFVRALPAANLTAELPDGPEGESTYGPMLDLTRKV